MKTSFRVLACAFLACVLSACPETTVNDDFGLNPVALEADDWSGSWMAVGDDDETFQFTITDAEKGVIVMTEPGDKDDKPLEFRLRRAAADDKADLLFALVHEKDGKPASTLHLLRESDEGVLLVWVIDDEAVEQAIKAGQLKGTTQRVKNDPHNHLDSDPASYAKLLEPQFWNWTEPAILRRVREKK
jgi:hypothetical protein